MSLSRNKVILSYGDYVIRQTELDILRSNAWLNDTLIGFYFDFLSTKRFPESLGFKFMGPEVTQCIKLGSSEDLPVFIGDLSALAKINVMFWPVNDSIDYNNVGGSHWSLLVFSRKENVFAHVDSTMVSGGGNDKAARRLYEKLAPVICKSAGYRNIPCESQRNGYDCGIYVLCNAELLAQSAATTGRILNSKTASAEIVANMRSTLLQIIQALASKSLIKS